MKLHKKIILTLQFNCDCIYIMDNQLQHVVDFTVYKKGKKIKHSKVFVKHFIEF